MKTENIKIRRKETLDHLNRIQGQIEALKKLIGQDEYCGGQCLKVATLTISIVKSFDSLKYKTLEGFVINHLLEGKSVAPEKLIQFQDLLKLHKK